MHTKQLHLDKIARHSETQPRTNIDYGVVDTYAEAYVAGATFPPAVVFFDGVVNSAR